MKRIILISLVMLLSVMASAYDFEVNGIFYNILSFTDKTVEVTNKNGNASGIYSGIIHIPERVIYGNTSFQVTAIGERAFVYAPITTVYLPEGILSIKKSAFGDCNQLNKCDLPESLTLIDSQSFSGTALDSVRIPGNAKLMTWCFSSCKMRYLEVAEGIKEIRYGAFERCNNLETVIFPSSLNVLAAGTFYGCDNLRTIISKRANSPKMEGYTRPTTGGPYYYNPFTSTESSKRPIYTLMVPNGAISSYTNYKTEDGKPGWPVATIESFDESTDFSKISTELQQDNVLYAITNTGNNSTLLLVKTLEDNIEDLIIRDKIVYNSIVYSVTSIHPDYISENKSLRTVHVYSETPVSIHENTFSANTKLFGTLYVPVGTKELYENAIEWRDFTNITESDEVIPPTPNPKCAAPTIIYSNGQLIFESETEDVKYVSSVICIDNKNHDTSIVPLTTIYRISVYATKDGYDDSDIVTKEISIRGLKGDVNEDGEINIADINTTIGIILGE